MVEPRDAAERTSCVQIEANIDDLDPRLWPHVLEQLLAAGAHDAWTTPILMKKGRPAFALGVLCAADQVAAMRDVIFRETTTIGLREFEVVKHALPRSHDQVQVEGEPISTKRAEHFGSTINESVEWDDVAQVANRLGISAKEVLAAAMAARQSGAR